MVTTLSNARQGLVYGASGYTGNITTGDPARRGNAVAPTNRASCDVGAIVAASREKLKGNSVPDIIQSRVKVPETALDKLWERFLFQALEAKTDSVHAGSLNNLGVADMKTIFITGAAHGIGLATARRFATQGWFVGMYDINREALDQLLGSDEFPNSCGQYCDVTDRHSIEEALAHFSAQSKGRLDVLVNNAGILASGRFEEIDYAFHDKIVDVNVKGLTNVAHAAFGLLKQTPNACLINLCSVSSVHGIPLLAVYSASKFYVNGLTEALHLEWAQHDIRVTSVKPPIVNTAMGHQLDSRLTEKLSMNMEPEHVAEAIQLAAEGSRMGYLLGTSGKLWGFVDKHLPESGRRALTRDLTGH